MAKLKKISAIAALMLIIGAAFLLIYPKSHAKNSCTQHNAPFSHTLCSFDPKDGTRLSLVWKGNDNAPMLDFSRLLKEHPNTKFAVNAGMYNAQYAPIGYTVIDGKEILSLNLKNGTGNFHLMPNGVFWWNDDGYFIHDSQTMDKLLKQGKKPKYATQSGPMLVIDGAIHPKFNQSSTSYKIRNGVGVCRDGQVKFVISDKPVSFYQFAQLFKDTLKCGNALFLDGGTASALYSNELERHDNKKIGVMIVAH